jgi:pilus assembly protein Flp/PilA
VVTIFQALHTLTYVVADRAKAVKEEKGASAMEYALLVGLIAVAVVTAVGIFSGKLETLFNNINVNPAPRSTTPAAG